MTRDMAAISRMGRAASTLTCQVAQRRRVADRTVLRIAVNEAVDGESAVFRSRCIINELT